MSATGQTLEGIRKRARLKQEAVAFWIGVICAMIFVGCGDRVDRNIRALESGTEDKERAMMELVLARADAIPALIRTLKDTDRPSDLRVDMVTVRPDRFGFLIFE